MGKHKTALNIITKCPESNTDWELLELLGDIYTFLNDNSNAKSSYLKAIERNNSKKILLKLGKLYVHENQSDQAQVLFNEYADKYDIPYSQILSRQSDLGRTRIYLPYREQQARSSPLSRPCDCPRPHESRRKQHLIRFFSVWGLLPRNMETQKEPFTNTNSSTRRTRTLLKCGVIWGTATSRKKCTYL